MRRMDLRPRAYDGSPEDVAARLARAGAPPPERLRETPWLLECLALALEERDLPRPVDRATLAAIHREVEAALPSSREDGEAPFERPEDPVQALARLGTRQAWRMTPDLVERLRAKGYDDRGLLDLVLAVADANQWARLHRLLGLPPGWHSP